MISWGITANSHDAAIAVFDGDKLVYAAHAERTSRIKNDKFLNQKLVDQCLAYGEPVEVHWYETEWLKRIRQIYAGQFKTAFTKPWPYSTFCEFVESYNQSSLTFVSGEIAYDFIEDAPVQAWYNQRHHHSHAAAGYYTSPFSDAAVLVIDAIGEFETLTLWEGSGDNLKKVHSQKFPNSVGLWYSAMTQRIGLKPNEDEYILMGWSALGDRKRLTDVIYRDFFEELKDGSMNVKLNHNLHRGCRWWRPDLNTIKDYADIAAGTQMVYEHILDHLLRETKKRINSDNLVLMGGCALNCLANGIAYKYFKNVWIMPNPGDAGSAVGAVLADKKKHINWTGPYLGYNIEGEYPVESALSELLVSGVCGVANGRAEFGPRALGNRSLLADPRGQGMKDRMNALKQRQDFRPFAPVIMAEYVHDYFMMPEGCNESPYMQFVGRCKYPERYPAIAHVDGTSRVQTVTREQHPDLYALLERWYAATNCPMLLNTSLNIKGEPMVDDEVDAARWQEAYGIKVFTRDD